MEFTYTVRAIQHKVRIGFNAWEVQNGGTVVTVRRGVQVVKQFPRVRSEHRAHQLAQAWIRRIRRMAGQVQGAQND